MKWKTLITIGLIIWGYWTIVQANTREKMGDYRPSLGQLVNAFKFYNDQYFYGNLPVSKTRIVLGDIQGDDDLARIVKVGDIWVLTVDPRWHSTEKQAEMSELHEMCHEEDMINGEDEGFDQHSLAFEACMESIAKRGGFKNLW